ncbi:MAG TPA: hypothetical protein VMV29_03940 [Ktedonobacterales bacterium]|nr:hypothetical protein [Ktedonobacterales bacterium]
MDHFTGRPSLDQRTGMRRAAGRGAATALAGGATPDTPDTPDTPEGSGGRPMSRLGGVPGVPGVYGYHRQRRGRRRASLAVGGTTEQTRRLGRRRYGRATRRIGVRRYGRTQTAAKPNADNQRNVNAQKGDLR